MMQREERDEPEPKMQEKGTYESTVKVMKKNERMNV